MFLKEDMPEIRLLSKTLNVTNPRKYVDDKVETLKPDEKREFMMTSLRNEIRTLEEREDYLSEYAFHCDKSTIIYIAGSLLLSTIPHDLTVALSGAMTSIGCTFMLDGTAASVTARLCREKAESLMKRLDGVWHERTEQS